MGNKTFIILLYLFEPLSTHEEVLLPVPSAKICFITKERLPKKFSKYLVYFVKVSNGTSHRGNIFTKYT